MESDKQRMVFGRASDLGRARRVYLALQNSGVEQGDIRFGGERARWAQEHTEDPAGKEQVDHELTRHVASHVVTGVLVGGLLGVLLGTVLALVAIVVAESDAWWWVGLGIAVFGAIGSVFGAFVAAERGLGVDDELELALGEAPGPVWVAVRVRDDDAAAAIESCFRELGVARIEEHDARARGVHLVEW